MTIEEIKKLNSVLNEMESAVDQLKWETQTIKEFEESSWTELLINFGYHHKIAINLPKEMIKSLLDTHYTSLRIKKIECERFLFVSGVDIENKKNFG